DTSIVHHSRNVPVSWVASRNVVDELRRCLVDDVLVFLLSAVNVCVLNPVDSTDVVRDLKSSREVRAGGRLKPNQSSLAREIQLVCDLVIAVSDDLSNLLRLYRIANGINLIRSHIGQYVLY